MRKLLLSFFSLFIVFGSLASAQTTTVTATITDSDTTVWINAKWTAVFVPNPNFPDLNQYSINGVPISSITYSQYINVAGTTNGSGVLSTTLMNNSLVLPAGSTYKFVIQSNTSAQATAYSNTVITGASQSLTTFLSNNAVAPRFPAINGAFGYADVEISVIPQPGGSYYNTTSNTARIWNGTIWANSGGTGAGGAFPNAINLNCTSDIGAQINTAVTTLGAVGGLIVLPNCTTATITTTATNIPPQISIIGYGRNSTIITCSVVGDCLQFNMNPTTYGEFGPEISDFQMVGSGTGQTLMHFQGMSGYTLHDLQFERYAAGGTAVCLELDNNSTGQFTEGNTAYSVYFERECTTGVLFNQNAGDSSFSFGYNNFWFKLVAQAANWGIVFNGGGQLYNGQMTVMCNHVSTNAGGGCMQFNNSFEVEGTNFYTPGERLFVTAEEDGTGSGTVLASTSSGQISFEGSIYNGSGTATPLATTTSNTGSGTLTITGSTGTATLGGAVYGGTTEPLQLVAIAAQAAVGIDIVEQAQASGKHWQWNVQSGMPVFYDVTDANTPFTLVGSPTGSSYNGLAMLSANSQFAWNSNTAFANTSAVADTGISRTAANTIAMGNGTQGNATAALSVGKINVLAARKSTFVCTAGGTITITNSNYITTSDVIITMNTAGGTITTPPAFKTVTSGTGFTVLCGATDTSTYNYDIIN